MKVIAINGSPRKNRNTAQLLQNALEGAKNAGAETEFIHLYDLNYSGCKSCFACKRQHSKNYGKCGLEDDLKFLFEKIENADVLLLGSPIYFGSITAEMRAFLERFLFQYMIYSNPISSVFNGKLKVAFIYTMNIKEETFNQNPLKSHLDVMNLSIERTIGNIEPFYSFFTYQTDNYNDMEYTYFDINEKREYHENTFPEDCKKAGALGAKMCV
jgi:multimeric flavodoxin WrbA